MISDLYRKVLIYILLYYQIGGGCRAWPKAPDLRSGFEGIRGFESLPPHLFSLKRENVHEKRKKNRFFRKETVLERKNVLSKKGRRKTNGCSFEGTTLCDDENVHEKKEVH